MKRTGLSGRVGRAAAGAAVVALAGGLAACGGNDSTVSSTPSVSATTAATESAAPTTAESAEKSSGAAQKPTGAAEPTDVPKTAPPETPQALPSDYPGPTRTELTERDHRLVDALKSQNIAFAQDASAAVSTADYVCAADGGGVSDDQIHATVLASIALDAQNRDADIDAEADTAAFIDTARKTFCQ